MSKSDEMEQGLWKVRSPVGSVSPPPSPPACWAIKRFLNGSDSYDSTSEVSSGWLDSSDTDISELGEMMEDLAMESRSAASSTDDLLDYALDKAEWQRQKRRCRRLRKAKQLLQRSGVNQHHAPAPGSPSTGPSTPQAGRPRRARSNVRPPANGATNSVGRRRKAAPRSPVEGTEEGQPKQSAPRCIERKRTKLF